jgi:hypothetical protein
VKTCAACGHELGLGRFCTNCGRPVETSATAPDGAAGDAFDWRTDTAERLVPRRPPTSEQPPAPPPYVPSPARVPPSAVTAPPPQRYPLFADEAPATDAVPVAASGPEPVTTSPTLREQPRDEPDQTERRPWLSWLAALVAIAFLAVGGYALWAFVLDDSGTPSARGADPAPTQSSSGPTPVDVAPGATAHAPDTAPPEEDVDGELGAYDASNMLDGVVTTAWRTPGDASGMRLTFKLAAPTRLTQVGILNGYAKRSTDTRGRDYDWYRGNRRVEAVVWELGKGTSVRQKLSTDREVQSISIEPVTTRKVVVRLVQVSAPGTGRASRDYTAVSEVSLVGKPAP